MGHDKSRAQGKIIAANASIEKEDRCQTNNLTLHLKECEKKKRAKSKLGRGSY